MRRNWGQNDSKSEKFAALKIFFTFMSFVSFYGIRRFVIVQREEMQMQNIKFMTS